MGNDKDVATFIDEMGKLITYYRLEYRLSYCEMVGALKLMADDLSAEARKMPYDDGEAFKDEEGDPI